MNCAYNAAEICVDAISKSPGLCISYDALKIQLKLSNPYIAAYVERNYNSIFKNFPEIFILKNGMISLTTAYLSLYFHKKSNPRGFSFVIRNSAVLYFHKILNLHGPQRCLSLIQMLANDKTQTYAEYFKHWTVLDALSFFASNTDYFFLNNNIVVAKPLCNSVLHNIEIKAKEKLNKFVCFLLECFESLHYFELSECISYAEDKCKSFLEQFTPMAQREYFKNLSNTVMDMHGFLYIKNKTASTSFSNKRKMKLLIICILAFKKEMHFKDLITEAIEKSKLSVSYFQDMTTDDQRLFFKKLSSYFEVSEDGSVKLLPTFTLPKCSFEDVSTTCENPRQAVCADVKCNTTELNSIKVHSSNQNMEEQCKTVSSVLSDQNNIKVNTPSQKLIPCHNRITLKEKYNEKDKPAQRMLNEFVRFLLNCFKSLHYFHLKECISYVEDSCKKFFEQLSVTELCEYFENIQNTIMDENGFLCLEGNVSIALFSTELKMKLVIVCILAVKKEMHFNDLMNEAIEKSKLSIDYYQNLSTEEQLVFLKKFPSTFFVSEDGYVKLLPKFTLPKCCFERLSTAFENTKQVSMEEKCKIVSSVHPNINNINVDSGNQTASNKHNNDERVIHSIEFEYVIYLLKFFKSLHYSTLRECVLYAEESCPDFLEHSSLFEQRQYILNSYLTQLWTRMVLYPSMVILSVVSYQKIKKEK